MRLPLNQCSACSYPISIGELKLKRAHLLTGMSEANAVVSFLSDPTTLVGLGVIALGTAYYMATRPQPATCPVPRDNQSVEQPVSPGALCVCAAYHVLPPFLCPLFLTRVGFASRTSHRKANCWSTVTTMQRPCTSVSSEGSESRVGFIVFSLHNYVHIESILTHAHHN